MEKQEKQIKIEKLFKKIDKHDLLLITTALYIAIILAYELMYCNFEFITKSIPNYNFSVYRIISYFSIYLVFLKFKDKFIEQAIEGFQSQTKCLFVCAIFAITFSIAIGGIIILNVNKTISLSIVILFIASFAFNLLAIYISNNFTQNIIVTALIIGFIFSISITFNNQLDEKRHFLSSYSVSLGNFNLKAASIEENTSNLPRQMPAKYFVRYFNKYPSTSITKEFQEKDIKDIPNDYPTVSYFLSGLGICIARTLGGSIADIYITGRIFNLLGYIFLMILAIHVLPYKKKILYAVFFMPMLLALASVYSVDGVGAALMSLFIAYCLKLHEKDNINIKEIFILGLLLILASTIKSLGYIGIALIILILPLKKIYKQNKKYMKYIGTVIAIIILGVAFVYAARIKQPGDPRIKGTNTSMQLEYVMRNPIKYIKTLASHTKSIFTNLDELSFLNAPMFFYSTYYYVFIMLMAYLLFISITDGTKRLKVRTRVIFILTFLLIYIMTSTIMYLGYTPVKANYIMGFQMRYLLPILFLILSSISIKKLELKNKLKYNNLIISCISSAFLIISAVDAIL